LLVAKRMRMPGRRRARCCGPRPFSTRESGCVSPLPGRRAGARPAWPRAPSSGVGLGVDVGVVVWRRRRGLMEGEGPSAVRSARSRVLQDLVPPRTHAVAVSRGARCPVAGCRLRMTTYLVTFLVSLVVGLVLTVLVRDRANAWGWHDRAGSSRKV